MGGGKGSREMTAHERESLERQAKEALKEGGESARHNVFISFSSEDISEVNLLRGQAKNENSDIEFNDFSLRVPFDSNRAEYIRRGIRERIRQSSVTVVYLSNSSATSKWVDWEIRESMKLGKGVVGMYKGSDPPRRFPKAIVDGGIKVVPWNQRELSRAIREASANR